MKRSKKIQSVLGGVFFIVFLTCGAALAGGHNMGPWETGQPEVTAKTEKPPRPAAGPPESVLESMTKAELLELIKKNANITINVYKEPDKAGFKEEIKNSIYSFGPILVMWLLFF
jgi:hypothetical protein